MSTKHLLQTLTQWSKGAATGRNVSDAYVQLGNDFKIVSKFFTHAKVDVSDLGDVPLDLRKVLEVTLREPASDETLNKYLPGIREIIVTLLDKLKVKQALLKNMRQDQAVKMRHRQHSSISSNVPLVLNSSGGATPSIGHSSPEHKDIGTSTKENTPTVNTSDDETTSFATAPSNQTAMLEPPKSRNSQNEEALIQLKKGTNLQRRASKRYSAYHMAKLTNQSTTEAAAAAALASIPNPPPQLPKSSLTETITAAPATIEVEKLPSPTKPALIDNTNDKVSADNNICSLFLMYKNKVKKCRTVLPTNMNRLRLLFVERFAYSPGGDSFPDIYIKDLRHGVFYELDDSNFSELQDGSTVELRIDGGKKEVGPINNIQEIGAIIKLEVAKSQKEIIDLLKSSNLTHSSADEKNVNHSAPESTTNLTKIDDEAVNKINRELAILKQVHNSNKTNMEQITSNLLEKVAKFKSMSFNTKTSANKVYMEKSQAELGEVSDSLLSRVDDLQDLIEVLRKDVADRGAEPSKKKLESVQKILEDAENDLEKMKKFISTEKPQWKKIWEAELDKVCEEQQFLTLQEDLVLDLNEDLAKAAETFGLINMCCEEKEKNPTRPKANPILPILKPGTFHQVRDQMLMAVESINPDHESRLKALDKAQRLWQKEKEFKDGDEFEDELGNFVGNSNLKKSGGVEEVERLRRQRDEENLRANFGGVL